MNFIIKDNEGKEHGPLNEDTLLKWVEAGDVLSDTPMRNALMSQWKTASDFSFLQKALEQQKEEEEKKDRGMLDRFTGRKGKKTPVPEKSTAFEYKYLPAPATIFLRLASAFLDLFILAIPALFLCGTAFVIFYFSDINSGYVPDAGTKEKAQDAAKQPSPPPPPPVSAYHEAAAAPLATDNLLKGFDSGSIWKDTESGDEFICISSSDDYAGWIRKTVFTKTFFSFFLIFLVLVLFYYGLSLGLYAQTAGMWFWGIFIAKPDLSEVYLLRAYFFTILMMPLGILSPIFVYIMPGKKALHDIISGTMLIKIAGKPKS